MGAKIKKIEKTNMKEGKKQDKIVAKAKMKENASGFRKAIL